MIEPTPDTSVGAGSRRRWRARPIIAAIVILVVVAYAATAILYTRSQSSSRVGLSTDESSAPERLAADVTTSAVDPIKGDLALRIQLTPEGGLAGPDGVSLAKPISVLVNSSTGKSSYQLKAGERINPIDVIVSLDDAGGSLYPFDSYHGEFFLVASAGSEAAPPAATASPVAPGSVIPVGLNFDGSLAGYSLDASRNATQETADIDVAVTIRRAPVTVAFALGVLILQGLIAIGALILATTVLRGRRPAELGMLTWLTALLFALTPLRNAMPSVPPIGILVDVLVYFWVIGAVTVSLLLVLGRILRGPINR